MKKSSLSKLIVFVVGLLLVFSSYYYCESRIVANNSGYEENAVSLANITSDEIIYLSDLDYITDDNWSYVGYGKIQKDQNIEGQTISLIENGNKKIYIKGMGVHSKGQLTYDISNVSNDYTRFVARVGVDSSRDTNGSVWFLISASLDGEDWTELLKTETLTGNSESVLVDVSVSGYKYFRIYVDPSYNGNTADHAVVADAKFVKADYVKDSTLYDKVFELDYYDNKLVNNDVESNLNDNYHLILEREFVNKIGYDEIQALARTYTKYKKTFDWILNDDDVLEQIIEVGEVNGVSFVEVLADLYNENEKCLNTKDGLVYQKMMIGLAASYSTDKVASALEFGHKLATYDYLERFSIYKSMYDDGSLGIYKDSFANYPMELVRLVMSDGARNDEIKWLNYYTKSKNYNQSVYAYVNHTGTGVGYGDEKYQGVTGTENYQEKYNLSNYNVPFGDSILRYWMIIDKGGICWNQSRVFQSLFNSIGSPTIGAYQPAHEVSFYFIPNEDGTGKWNIANNIFGWGKTATSWYGGNTYRTIFNWGNKSFTNKIINSNSYGNNGGYIYLAQENLNRYDEYKQSLYLNLLANSYSDNDKKIEIYNLTLSKININLDSYDYIINTYKQMNNVTNDDWYNLALEIIDSYTYYPMAMDDLLNVIKPYLNGAQVIDVTSKEKNALNLAVNATSDEVLHDQAAREIAKALLNKVTLEVATFSFDGEKANTIVFDDTYKNYDFVWHYSLDGGKTKSIAIAEKEYLLSTEEVKKINDVNDILIYIDGLALDQAAYTIDIVKGVMPTVDNNDALYANDLENSVMGVTDLMEWRYSETDVWKSYSENVPDLTGDKVIHIRVAAGKNALASDYNTYIFTKDKQEVNKKYIPISHLSIDGFSSQAEAQSRFATNSIDGNYNTNWHSAWNGSDTERYIIIKVDIPIYLSAVDYVPGGGGNGKIIDGVIEGSIDGVNWVKLGEKSGLSYTGDCNAYNYGLNNVKTFETDSSALVQYVKITATKASNGNWFNARMFNLYQDTTDNSKPTAGIVYNINDVTNKDVVATLINFSSENIKITSEGGNTHIFKENGIFEFTFIDTFTGKEGSAIAVVDWIDKEAPTAEIEYSTMLPTNGSVIATLKPSKEITVINNGKFTLMEDGTVLDDFGTVLQGYSCDEKGNVTDKNGNYVTNMNTLSYEFIQNGEFTFEFVDKAGNKGTKTAKVDWIDTEKPEAVITYSNLFLTNKDVVVSLSFNEKVIITNNGGKNYYTFKENGEFTFEFVDEAGNSNVAIAKVTWIDKSVPTASLIYDKSNNDKAIVKVVNPSKEIVFENNEEGIFEYYSNGIYEIVFYDMLGNKGSLNVVVDWLNSYQEDSDNIEDDTLIDNKDNGSNDNNTNQGNDSNQNNSSDKDNIQNSTNVDNSNKNDNSNEENNSYKDTIDDLETSNSPLEDKSSIKKIIILVTFGVATGFVLLTFCCKKK